MTNIRRRLEQLRTVVVLSATLLLVAASARGDVPASQAAKTKRLFWKITSPTTEVYFLGSIHVATPDMYPLPAEIEAAYGACDNLVVEADITKDSDQMAAAMQLMLAGSYPQGDSLDKHVSPDTFKELTDFCTTNGIPLQIFSGLKPPLAAMTIEALFYQKAGLSPEDGIDMHFLTAANKAKDKKIVELESSDFQIKLLTGIDDKLADKWLAETLKESSKDDVSKLVKAWKEGDAKTVDDEMTADEKKDADAAKMNDLMIYQRNAEMVKKIEDMLKGKEKVFVVVGAAHLVGEKGVLAALEKKGYKVERPELTPPAAGASRPAASEPSATP